jgi:allantoicase
LADEHLGTQTISVTDDWFADVVVCSTNPSGMEGRRIRRQRQMDGWLSRRKRFEGYDSAVIRLGVAGSIKTWTIDAVSLPATSAS